MHASEAPTGAPPRRIRPEIQGLDVSPTLGINEASRRAAKAGRRVIRFGLGQSPFPVPDPVVEELRANAHRKDYLPPKGLPSLREAVADYHQRRSGVPPDPDRVLVGPGSKELMFLLQIVHAGELWVPTPAWVSYGPQARIAGRPVSFLPTRREGGWRLSPEDLDARCRRDGSRSSRILILNYPGNPTGATYDAGELEELAGVCRRHGLIVLSDEIYGELHHQGKHVSIASFAPECTIVSGGLSKWCGAGGWRLGTFVFPPHLDDLLAAMTAVASETYTSTSAPVQYAAVRAFRGGMRMERYLRNARRILAALGAALTSAFRGLGLSVSQPAGGFYLYVDFSPLADPLRARGIGTGPELARRLLDEAGLAVLPASAFGRPEAELAVRMAYVDFDGARAMVAAEALPASAPIDMDFLRSHCGEILDAVPRTAAWLDVPPNPRG